jgi:FkbM family methyltransferase
MLLKSIKRVISRRIRNYIYHSEGSSFCAKANKLGRFVGFRSKVDWEDNERLYKVCDRNACIYIPRKKRVRMHMSGVQKRLAFIKNEYLINDIPFADGDVIIDIGANIGELSMALSAEKELKIIAIEPEKEEISALNRNLQGGEVEIYDCVLWSSSDEIDFYSANDTGDSSVFQQFDNVQPSRRKAYSLDDLVGKSKILRKIEKIKLLKLEAEGAEPEILEGATEILQRIEYVTVDVGAERGMEKESTLIPVQSILMYAGYEPIKFGLPRAVMLFRNKRSLL